MPVDERLDRIGVPHIVQTGTCAAPVSCLSVAQARHLAASCESVFCHIDGDRTAVLAEKEGRGLPGHRPVTHLPVCRQPFCRARGQRDDPPCVGLGMTDLERGRSGIDIVVVEMQGFTDPQSGHRKQAEERRIG